MSAWSGRSCRRPDVSPPFLGPVFTADGPLLVEALVGRKGTFPEVHRRATRLVVDDYGDAVCYERRCGSCMRWLPLDFAWFAPRRDHIGRGMQGRCRECVRVGNGLRYRDKDYACRAREIRRIDYRLRREIATGRHASDLPSTGPRRGPVVNGREGVVPAGPLVEMVKAALASCDDGLQRDELARIGLDQHSWSEMSRGVRQTVRFTTADRLVCGLGLNPWDVWRPEDDPVVFELVSRLWGFGAMSA